MDSNKDKNEKDFHQLPLNEVIEIVYFSKRNSYSKKI
jgi:hypothetical protein